jgi:hypothetical protein
MAVKIIFRNRRTILKPFASNSAKIQVCANELPVWLSSAEDIAVQDRASERYAVGHNGQDTRGWPSDVRLTRQAQVFSGREEPVGYAFCLSGHFRRDLMNRPRLPRDDVDQKSPIDPGLSFRAAGKA